MKREQRWTPDTCANPATGDVCIWIEEWDDEVDPIARSHDLVRRERACTWHAAETPESGFVRCYEENRRKNMSFNAIQTTRPGVKHEEFQWSLDANGVVTVSVTGGFTPGERNSLRNALDIQFGPGKVVVQ